MLLDKFFESICTEGVEYEYFVKLNTEDFISAVMSQKHPSFKIINKDTVMFNPEPSSPWGVIFSKTIGLYPSFLISEVYKKSDTVTRMMIMENIQSTDIHLPRECKDIGMWKTSMLDLNDYWLSQFGIERKLVESLRYESSLSYKYQMWRALTPDHWYRIERQYEVENQFTEKSNFRNCDINVNVFDFPVMNLHIDPRTDSTLNSLKVNLDASKIPTDIQKFTLNVIIYNTGSGLFSNHLYIKPINPCQHVKDCKDITVNYILYNTGDKALGYGQRGFSLVDVECSSSYVYNNFEELPIHLNMYSMSLTPPYFTSLSEKALNDQIDGKLEVSPFNIMWDDEDTCTHIWRRASESNVDNVRYPLLGVFNDVFQSYKTINPGVNFISE
jgi:hypothetical protein